MTQSNFNFYKTQEVYGETYYKLLKVFFSNPKYKKKLSLEAKAAFGILLDRFNYSIKNNWIDEEDNIYFIYTNQQLMDVLDCSEKKVIKIKKELENVNLLFQKRIGINQPNRLYLAKPEVSATDVYKQVNAESLGTSGTVKNAVPESLGTSGTVKNAVPDMAGNTTAESLGTSGTVKNAANLYIDHSLDNNRYNKDTTTLDFSKEKYTAEQLEQQDQDLMKHAKEYLSDPESRPTFLNEESLDLLGKWCNTSKELKRYIGVILNARKDVEKEKGVTFFLDTDKNQQKITNTIRRFFNAIRSERNHIRTTTENYLYGTFKNLFTEIAIDLLNDEWKNKENKNEEEFLANIERQLNNRQ